MAPNKHPHTTAVKIASDTMAKVIESFGQDPKFMAPKKPASVPEITLKRND